MNAKFSVYKNALLWQSILMANEDFEIVDGALKKYNGNGGDVAIPESVESIDSKAFANCWSLDEVTVPADADVADDAFEDDCEVIRE